MFMVENTVAGNTALSGGVESESGRGEGGGATDVDCEVTSPFTFTSSHQICALVGQSVVLGYLSDYFSVEDPTADETRDAYLFATGGW